MQTVEKEDSTPTVNVRETLVGPNNRDHYTDTSLANNALPLFNSVLAGREQELADLFELARQNPHTILVITGASGYGKTSIARQLVAVMQDHGIEAYVDASLVESAQALAHQLVALFPEPGWSTTIKFGGKRIDQLAPYEVTRFLSHLVSVTRCCIVIDHAEKWFADSVTEEVRYLHLILAVLAREASHLVCILTTVKSPPAQLPYRFVVYPIGPTLGSKGAAILRRHIAASDLILDQITNRFHGHPYILDLISRKYAGAYTSSEAVKLLVRSISDLPGGVTQILSGYILSLPKGERTVLLGLAGYSQPIPSEWIDYEVSASLYDKGLLAHKVDLDVDTSGWVVHPLIQEAIKYIPQLTRETRRDLFNLLSSAVKRGHALASLPLAQHFSLGSSPQKALAITKSYWRLWCESRGIDEGLRFVEMLLQIPGLSEADRQDLQFALGVLHLYKGDSNSLFAARQHFFTITNTSSTTQIQSVLYLAAVAEQMEVTRRIEGISSITNLYRTLIMSIGSENYQNMPVYEQGLVYFLLGHACRYAEDFDAALSYYARALNVFQLCTTMNCILEAKHTVYSMGMAYLKTGNYEAASQMVCDVQSKDEHSQLTFIGGLLTYLRASTALSSQHYDEAERLTKMSIDSFRRFQSFAYGARAEILLAWTKLLRGDEHQAAKQFQELKSRESLPKGQIGRVECGLALAISSSRSVDFWQTFLMGLQKVIDSGDILCAMAVVRCAIERGFGKHSCEKVHIDWGKIDHESSEFISSSKLISKANMEELYLVLHSLRPNAPQSDIAVSGFV